MLHSSDSSPPSSRPRVAVVFGGRSAEHAISCATAASVLAAIDREVYDVVPIGITRAGEWVQVADDPAALRITGGNLPAVPETGGHVVLPLGGGERAMTVQRPGEVPTSLGEVDVVFPVLHGPFGEDGTIQGFLELADVRYVGCGVLASAAMMDKHVMKVLFASVGLPMGDYAVITDLDWRRSPAAALERCAALQFPVFVKPTRAGSSVGISKVETVQGLRPAIELARQHDPKVIVEAGIEGREVECGVLQGRDADAPRVSEVGEITVSGDHAFYDFEAKYLDEDHVNLRCPADLPTEVSAEVRAMAATAFDVAGCEGLARVDCFFTTDGQVLINEINTMPGFTPWSMYPQVWAASGMSYPELVHELIELALARPLGLR
ncbi:MAG: D-alanine--D-alanine ligase family protein [Ornithinimicrobium sp.]